MRVRTNKYLEQSDWLNSTDAKYLDYNFTVPSYKMLKAVQHKISDAICNEALRHYRKGRKNCVEKKCNEKAITYEYFLNRLFNMFFFCVCITNLFKALFLLLFNLVNGK